LKIYRKRVTKSIFFSQKLKPGTSPNWEKKGEDRKPSESRGKKGERKKKKE